MDKVAREDLMDQKGVVTMEEEEVAMNFLTFPIWSILFWLQVMVVTPMIAVVVEEGVSLLITMVQYLLITRVNN